MTSALQANWGDAPYIGHVRDTIQSLKWTRAAFEGRTLQQALEGITFWFTIDGVSRACTHQLVRSRFAAFMQHGGRDNDWRHQGWTMPETIYRAIGVIDGTAEDDGMISCIEDPEPLRQLVKLQEEATTLHETIEVFLAQAKELYAALVDAGIPWQDARRVLPIGTQTYIHAVYNFVSLKDFLAKRLEHVMDWEINCVAQLMLRAVRLACPLEIGMNLMSMSDRQHQAAFARLDSWPPDKKWPDPTERCGAPVPSPSGTMPCGHAKANHEQFADAEEWCAECKHFHAYTPMDSLKRTHRREQNPFWILDPKCYTDESAPIRWIPTNGTYPEDLRPQL